MPHYRVYPRVDVHFKSDTAESSGIRKKQGQKSTTKATHLGRPVLGLWVGAALAATSLLFIVAAYW